MTELRSHLRDASDDDDARTDEDLVAAMRLGDKNAYEMLWKRHVTAARRAATRLTPSQADDLVSEAFLAVYDQTLTNGKGPTGSFRPYLFAVMRNISARWYRESTQLSYSPDADIAVESEALHGMERAYDATVILSAFRALPERWQRVLWLTDVEDVGRPAIAAELGLRPNAVSVLSRRARTGLRVQWLFEQIPRDLRTDDAHAAAILPALIVSGKADGLTEQLRHLRSCGRCHDLELELRAAYRVGRKSGVSVGSLAALGVIIPTAGAVWGAAGPTTAVAALGLGGAAALIAGILAIGVGAGIVAPVFQPKSDPVPALAAPSTESTDGGTPSTPPPAGAPTTAPQPPVVNATPPRPPAPVAPAPPTIDIVADGTGEMPARPEPQAPELPGTVVTPGQGAEGKPTVVITDHGASYLAPVLSGSVPAGTEVALRVGANIYRAEPSGSGTWSFDLRSLGLPAGTHTASVWTITNGTASGAADVAFTIRALGIAGLPEYTPVTLADSVDQGLTFTVTGPPGGTVCLDSDTGQSASIPLDPALGTASRRIRFFAYGIYVLRLTACDGASFGPDSPRTVSVVEGVFDPWIVEDEPRWEIDEP